MKSAFSIDPEPPEEPEDDDWNGEGLARERDAAWYLAKPYMAHIYALQHFKLYRDDCAARFLTGSTFPDGTPDPWFDQMEEDNAIYEHQLGMELKR